MIKKSILILVGSGHKDSCSYKIGKNIVDYFDDELFDIQLIDIAQLDLRECLGCEYCKAHQGICIIKDAMTEIYQEIAQSDILIFISPVYFSNIPAMLKKLIDRCQLFYNLRDKSSIKRKQFLGIHLGGAPEYKDQFTAFKNTYNVLLPDIKAEMKGIIQITDTDKKDPLLDNHLKKEIKLNLEQLIA